MPEIQDFINSPLLRVCLKQVELLNTHNTSNLDKFLWNALPLSIYQINQLTKDTVCVTVRTTGMILVNPYCYSSTLQNDGKYKCKCGIISDNTVPRYKVEIKVVDKQEEISLMFWNPHVVDLLGVAAADLKQRMLEDGEDDPKAYPELLDELLGRQLAFRVKAKPGNKLSILAVSEDPDYIQAILPLIQSEETTSMIKGAIKEVDEDISSTTQSLSDMAEHDPDLKDQITPAKRSFATLKLEEGQSQRLGTQQLSSTKTKKIMKA